MTAVQLFPMFVSNVHFHHGHAIGGDRSGLIRADRRGVAHRFAGVQMSNEIIVVHHLLIGEEEQRSE